MTQPRERVQDSSFEGVGMIHCEVVRAEARALHKRGGGQGRYCERGYWDGGSHRAKLWPQSHLYRRAGPGQLTAP